MNDYPTSTRESPALDRYLRDIEHSCNIYCEPPIHYYTIRGDWVKGPLIVPPHGTLFIYVFGLGVVAVLFLLAAIVILLSR